VSNIVKKRETNLFDFKIAVSHV